jgi:hypothetical protein
MTNTDKFLAEVEGRIAKATPACFEISCYKEPGELCQECWGYWSKLASRTDIAKLVSVVRCAREALRNVISLSGPLAKSSSVAEDALQAMNQIARGDR